MFVRIVIARLGAFRLVVSCLAHFDVKRADLIQSDDMVQALAAVHPINRST